MRLAGLVMMSAVSVPLALAGHAGAAEAPRRAAPDVALAGSFGVLDLPLRSCFRRSRAALRGQNFVVKLAQNIEDRASVVVGEIGGQTEASVKCFLGAGEDLVFFAVDVASTIPGAAGDLAGKVTSALLPPEPGQQAGSGPAAAEKSGGAGKVRYY